VTHFIEKTFENQQLSQDQVEFELVLSRTCCGETGCAHGGGVQASALTESTAISDATLNNQHASLASHPALEFLLAMDGDPAATFNIECYTDLPKGEVKPKPDPLLARYPNLSIGEVERLLPTLERANAAGAGVFFCVNQCQGQRSKKNVTRVRCMHGDFDSATAAMLENVYATLHPSIALTTSGTNRCHLYWLLSKDQAISKEVAEALNKSLVLLGADLSATDVSRLLRLPGFRHMKYRAEGVTPMVIANYFHPTR
jgi:hypothetical protein